MSRRRILVPLKGFDEAKGRLRAEGLDGDQWARMLAAGVLRELPDALVVSDDANVARFAHELDHDTLAVTTRGLNESLTEAVHQLAVDCDQIVVVHADLLDPSGLSEFDPDEGVTIVTDQHGDGTPVLAIPARSGFVFRYGPHSARRHLEEAGRWGLRTTVLTGQPWARDVDRAEDLSGLR